MASSRTAQQLDQPELSEQILTLAASYSGSLDMPKLPEGMVLNQDGLKRSEAGRKNDDRDSDVFYCSEVDEFPGARYVWTWKGCVCHDDCSPRAWAKVFKSSPVSLADCLDLMRHHLHVSGKHELEEPQIMQRLEEVLQEPSEWISVAFETPQDRQKYRDYMDKKAKPRAEPQRGKKRAKSGAADASGAEPKAAAGGAPLLLDAGGPALGLHAHEGDALQFELPGLRNFQLTTATRGEVRAAMENRDVLKMSFRQAQILHDSLRRAADAAHASVALAEAQVRQFQAEGRVFSAASRILQEIVNENSRR